MDKLNVERHLPGLVVTLKNNVVKATAKQLTTKQLLGVAKLTNFMDVEVKRSGPGLTVICKEKEFTS